MAQTFQMRRHNVQLQKHLSQLTSELTSGVKNDAAKAVSGDFKALASIDRSLRLLESYHSTTSEAALFTQTLQNVFEITQSLTTDVAPSLLSVATNGNPTMVEIAAGDARQKFFSVVGAINTQVGDRYLLSGTSTDQKPITDASEILNELMLAVNGQTTAAGVASAVTAWFDAPPGGGGYLDTVYGGSSTTLSPFHIAEGETASLDITAADPAIRNTLKGLALAAVVAEGVLPGDFAGHALLTKTAGEKLLASNDQLAILRARIGTVEGHIDEVATRNSAHRSALEIARTEIIAADPYETASALEAVQTQIETLYSLTARLSRLTLADYLR
jgi:flagellar hook-associated protein 3 FlgL